MADSHSSGNDPDWTVDDESRSDLDATRRNSDHDDADDGERPWRTKDDEPEKGRGSVLREIVIIVGCVLLLTWLLQTFVGRQYVIPSESMEPTLHGCAGCTNDRIVIDKLTYRFGDVSPGDVVVFKVPESWNEGWLSPRSSNPVIHRVQDGLSWFGFAPPDENDYIKRVIATGGQTIACKASDKVGVTVNGKPINEPYVDMKLQEENLAQGTVDPRAVDENGKLNSCLGPDFGPIKIPDGHVWVMGDNRTNSSDSRYHTPSPEDPDYQSKMFDGTVPESDIRGKTRFIIYPFSRIGGVSSINPQG